MALPANSFGLYIHIPFCSHLCHYCDFAKTARFDKALVEEYFAALEAHLKAWADCLHSVGIPPRFSSVFFGGGTPGLFAEEFGPLFNVMSPLLAPDAEISLEANPGNITRHNLTVWRSLGFNRLSLGVQSFQAAGLTTLVRDHDEKQALSAIAAAAEFFPNHNIDLIYGWPGQNLDQWRSDLEVAVKAGVPHLSLYNLTYEPRTPLGRKAHRGVVAPQTETFEEACFNLAADTLATHGYRHEEVSNWAKAGHGCLHNYLYWQGFPYIGVGAGAHGYLGSRLSRGTRYSYPKSVRGFLQHDLIAPEMFGGGEPRHFPGVDRGRDDEAWLLEYVGAGLRAETGIDLDRVKALTSRAWRPRPAVITALGQGLMHISPTGTLTLHRSEWFREAAWSLEVAMSFPSGDSLL